MADATVEFSRTRQLPFRGGLPKRLRRFYWDEYISARLGDEQHLFGKLKVLFQAFGQNPEFIWFFCRSRFRKYLTRQEPDTVIQIRKELHRLGLDTLSPVNLDFNFSPKNHAVASA
jgi:hypothetical protein